MTEIALEINDAGLLALTEAGPAGPASPGFALLDGREIHVGERARRAARLEPRFVSHRHWERLDLDPVGRPFPRGATHADLVYAHLSRFWAELVDALDQPTPTLSVLLVVPGSYAPEELGLLAGIARACEIPVVGMVDAAVAAVSSGWAEGPAAEAAPRSALHLDLRQHRAVWSLVRAGERLRRSHVESLEGAGLARFQQAWLGAIAESFVRGTRFDPLHDGATEQVLFDRLPEWIGAAEAGGATTPVLDGGGQTRSVEVTAAELAAAAGAEIDLIVGAARPLVEPPPREGLGPPPAPILALAPARPAPAGPRAPRTPREGRPSQQAGPEARPRPSRSRAPRR